MGTTPNEVTVQGCAPFLLVASVAANVHYFTQQLGFTLDLEDGEPPLFAMVHRGGCYILLRQTVHPVSDRPNPTVEPNAPDLSIQVSDVDRLYDELSARGAVLLHPPTTRSYGHKDMGVGTPDGYALMFWSEVQDV